MARKIYREQAIRIVAGLLLLIGTALSALVSRWWLLVPGLLGVDLIQSVVTGFCPVDAILKRAGVPSPLEEYLSSEGE